MLYTRLCVTIFQDISNADMWQIAGVTAIEMAKGPKNIEFVGGRQDCSTSPSTTAMNPFPAPTMTRTEMMNWFKSNPSGFGMEDTEVSLVMYFSIEELFCLCLLVLRILSLNKTHTHNQ